MPSEGEAAYIGDLLRKSKEHLSCARAKENLSPLSLQLHYPKTPQRVAANQLVPTPAAFPDD